jgi:hypothetical protein
MAKPLAFLTQTRAKLHMQKFDRNIGFREKRHFFAENWQKVQKIVIIPSTPDWANFRLFAVVQFGPFFNLQKWP